MLNNKFFCYYPKIHHEINNLLKTNLDCFSLYSMNNFYVIFASQNQLF